MGDETDDKDEDDEHIFSFMISVLPMSHPCNMSKHLSKVNVDVCCLTREPVNSYSGQKFTCWSSTMIE